MTLKCLNCGTADPREDKMAAAFLCADCAKKPNAEARLRAAAGTHIKKVPNPTNKHK